MKLPKGFKAIIASPDGKQWGRHNYAEPMQRLMAEFGQAGLVSVVDVAHDNWCRIYDGGFCNCDPDYTIRDAETGKPIKTPEQCREFLGGKP